MADRAHGSLFLDSHHDVVVVGRCPLGGPLRLVVDLALLAQDGVPGFGQHVSSLVLVHCLVPSFSQPHALLDPSPFLVWFTLQYFTILPVHYMIFLTAVFILFAKNSDQPWMSNVFTQAVFWNFGYWTEAVHPFICYCWSVFERNGLIWRGICHFIQKSLLHELCWSVLWEDLVCDADLFWRIGSLW